MEELSKLRDDLYEALPSGELDAFELIKIIKSHITKLDELIELKKLRVADVSGQLAISALEKIVNPIKYLQDEAEKDGARLNGYMAIEVTKDVNFYKEIARKALQEIANLR